MTVEDTLGLVIDRFGDPEVWRATGVARGRGLTNDEAVALGYRTVRAPLRTVLDWLLPRVRLRPGLGELVAVRRPLILSSGFREFIDPVLARAGLVPGRDVEVVANTVEASPSGWRVVHRNRKPCPSCGEPCKRQSLPPGPVVYAGDGYSDRCAALAAERVFARGTLAAYLDEQGVGYEPLEDFFEVSRALSAGAPASGRP